MASFLHMDSQEPVLELAESESGGSVVVGCLWFLVIALMFFAQHHVCDAYFVPAINVFVEKMRKHPMQCAKRWGEEAVAGATICALGCNGPELFSNLISLYTCSDAGIGVVVGSEIFNLLIIVGCSVLAAPTVPLQLEKVPFTRDCLFYAVSIGLLYWTMSDKKVTFFEAKVLLGAAVFYVAGVYFTTDIVNCIPAIKPDAKVEDDETKNKTMMHGVKVEVHEVLHGGMADRGRGPTHIEIDFKDDGIVTSNKAPPKVNARGSVGIQLDESLLGAKGKILHYENLSEVLLMSEGSIRLEFIDKVGLGHVSLIVKAEDGEGREQLLAGIKEHDNLYWVHDYDATVFGAFRDFKHHITDTKHGILTRIMAIPEFFIDVLLKSTLFMVDVKDVSKENRWAWCFLGAMAWLAIFSYAMLEVANFINYNIPAIPIAFLGITVCAVGTSFPNAVASVIMSSQNKPAAAIANALGSNVQNVFLAMALPWVIYMVHPGYDCGLLKLNPASTVLANPQVDGLIQDAAGLTEGIIWMVFTLVLMVALVLLPDTCALSIPNGLILIFFYVVYVALTSAETFMGFALVDKCNRLGFFRTPLAECEYQK